MPTLGNEPRTDPRLARTLGEAIRARRLELGLSQEEFAARVGDGMGQSGVSQLERGKVGLPRRRRLESIATALDLPMGELLARSGWADADLHLPQVAGGAEKSREVGRHRVEDARAFHATITEGMDGAPDDLRREIADMLVHVDDDEVRILWVLVRMAATRGRASQP